MSYEYEEINRAIVQQNGIDNNINRGNLLREIDEVYALAEKLPEYEAKAKAFDRIVKESKGTFSCGDFCDGVRHIINSYEIGVAKDD